MSSAVFCRNHVGIDDYYCDLLGYRMWFNILTGDALRKPNSCVGTTLPRAERRIIFMFELLGFRHLDFSTDDGSSVKGDQLFVAFAEDGVTGRMADKLFIRDGIALPALTPGMMLDISFNRKGRVISVKAATTTPAKA